MWNLHLDMGLDVRKLVFGKVQTRVLLLFAFWKVLYLNLLQAKFHFLASLWFESHFVGNPEDRFCCVEAHMVFENFMHPKASCWLKTNDNMHI